MKKLRLFLLPLLLVTVLAGCKEPPQENHYVDTWFEDGQKNLLQITVRDDDTWVLYDVLLPNEEKPNALTEGKFTLTGDGALELAVDNQKSAVGRLKEDGTMEVAPAEDGYWPFSDVLHFSRTADSKEPAKTPSFTKFVGLWKYDNAEEWLKINKDGSWQRLDANSYVLEDGMLTAFEHNIEIKGKNTYQFFCTGPDTLTDNLGNILRYTDRIEQTKFFDLNNLDANLTVKDKRKRNAGGSYFYAQDGSQYERGDVYWDVRLMENNLLADGTRDVRLKFTCCFAGNLSKKFNGLFSSGSTTYLCDRYTGCIIPTGNVTNDGSTGISQTVEINGKKIPIQYTYEVTWDKNNPNWEYVMYKEVHIKYPDNYDGLAICLPVAYRNYDDMAAGSNRDDKVPYPMTDDQLSRCQEGLIFYLDSINE